MNPKDVIKKYPRIAVALLTIAAETDLVWAATIIDDARCKRSLLAQGLVQEARRNRHLARSLEAVSLVNKVIDDVPFTFSTIHTQPNTAQL